MLGTVTADNYARVAERFITYLNMLCSSGNFPGCRGTMEWTVRTVGCLLQPFVVGTDTPDSVAHVKAEHVRDSVDATFWHIWRECVTPVSKWPHRMETDPDVGKALIWSIIAELWTAPQG